jgi:hypothetical protein
MGECMPVINDQGLVKRMKCLLKTGEGKEGCTPEKVSVTTAAVDFKGMVKCIDGVSLFPQFLMRSPFVIKSLEIFGVLRKCAIKISDSILETAKMIQCKTFP